MAARRRGFGRFAFIFSDIEGTDWTLGSADRHHHAFCRPHQRLHCSARRADWQNIQLPSLLWPNTFVLLLSSFTLELAKARDSQKSHRSHERVAWSSAQCLACCSLPASLPHGGSWCTQAFIFRRRLQSGFFYHSDRPAWFAYYGGVIALGFVMAKALQKSFDRFQSSSR